MEPEMDPYKKEMPFGHHCSVLIFRGVSSLYLMRNKYIHRTLWKNFRIYFTSLFGERPSGDRYHASDHDVITHLKFKIAPEKWPSQKESNLPTIHFQVLC